MTITNLVAQVTQDTLITVWQQQTEYSALELMQQHMSSEAWAQFVCLLQIDNFLLHYSLKTSSATAAISMTFLIVH